MNMKAHLLAGIAIAALTLPAMAADMPVKARPLPPVPVVGWGGFYIGGNAGYGVGRDRTTMTTVSGAGFPILAPGTPIYGTPQQFTLAPHGWAAGAQAGYNFQIAPTWILGVETDIQGTGMKDTANCILVCNARIATVPALAGFPVTFSDDSLQHKLNWFGTVRGRFGATAGPALFYVTGGLAYGEVERRGRVAGTTTTAAGGAVNTFAGSFDNTSTKTGWTVGGGVEAMLAGGWSAKAEYLYVDLGTVGDSFNTTFLTGGGGAGAVGAVAANRTDRGSNQDHIFRIGVNYHLGGGGDLAYAAIASSAPAKSGKSATSARAQYPMTPVESWTGFYLGPNFGYGVGRDSTTMTTVSGAGFRTLAPGTPLYGAPRQFALVPHGFVGGGGAGYNWQPVPNWLFGVEADLQGTSMQDSAHCLLTCNARIITVPTPLLSGFPVVFSDVSAAHKLNWLSTVRGRVGATFGPALLYLTGGAAFGEVERSARAAGSTLRNGNVFNTFAGSHFEKSTKDGWTLGGGIEGQVMTSWSVKAEYLYVDLGRTNDSFNTTFLTGGGGVVGSVAGVRVDRSDIRDQIFRVGLNYHPPGQ